MKHLLLLFALIATLSCCKNDDDQPQNPIDQLPPATQTGENTFGCLVNGEPLSITNSNKMTAIYQGGGVQFGGGGIYILVVDPFVINESYQFVSIGDGIASARFTEDDDGPAMCYYDFENTNEGYVRFSKIDKVNYIVSGTFEFSTKKDNCENVTITNGRFDMKYIP